jgi:hypothetical protein
MRVQSASSGSRNADDQFAVEVARSVQNIERLEVMGVILRLVLSSTCGVAIPHILDTYPVPWVGNGLLVAFACCGIAKEAQSMYLNDRYVELVMQMRIGQRVTCVTKLFQDGRHTQESIVLNGLPITPVNTHAGILIETTARHR